MRWPWTKHAKTTRVASSWRPEFDALGRYNAERARGILHTETWQVKMADLQRQFDEAYGRSGDRTDGLPMEL